MKTTYLCVISKLILDFIRVISCQTHIILFPKDVAAHRKQKNLKYILMWSSIYRQDELVEVIPTGQDFFINNRCPVQNCFFVWSHFYFNDVTEYDAILFHGPRSTNFFLKRFPTERSPNQVYVFLNNESPEMFPICETIFDNDFFNVTVTYRFNSDIYYSYMIVRNKLGDLIGPKKTMHWMKVEDMLPIDDYVKSKLKEKYKAAAWFVSNCHTPGKREVFVKQLQEELEKYMLRVDIYGNCGNLTCGKSECKSARIDLQCWTMVQKDYFFYLAFENSLSEDYVTEKLLNALQFYTVPIVYGGANYTRFMPDGMYLNAIDLGVKHLAKEMHAIITNRERYYSFFKWHNHYSYYDPNIDAQTNPFCKICAYIHGDQIKYQTTYKNFLSWWNGPCVCKKDRSSCRGLGFNLLSQSQRNEESRNTAVNLLELPKK